MLQGTHHQIGAWLLGASLIIAVSGQAWAHAHVVAQTPAADAPAQAPAETCISFDSALEPAFSKLQVQDAQGQSIAVESSVSADGKTLCARLPALAAGAYQGHWVAVASDGHRMKGQYSFSVR